MLRKFKQEVKKEFFIYLVIFFILALISHSDLLTNPSARFQMLREKENYFHPFLYTLILYTILFIIRKVLDFIIGLFEHK